MSAKRHSRDGVRVGRVGVGAAVIATAVAIALAAAWRLILSFGGALHGPEVRPAPMPQPVLEQQPLLDRRAYEAKEKANLAGYAWIDREKGVVRIPIDAAMILVSQRAASGQSREDGMSP